jgi:hypothetical protein
MEIMKKIMMVALVMAGMVVSANADLTKFRWYATAASNLVNNSNIGIAVGNATVLTYLSADNTINFNPAVLLANTYGNDTYYQAQGITLAGRLTCAYLVEVGPTPDYRGKFAYAIVLDMPLTTFNTTYGGLVANVPAGTWYDVTPISVALADMNIVPPPTAQTFVPGSLKTDTQVIPEPATALLFGIGAMGAWMIRRNKIKSKEQADA